MRLFVAIPLPEDVRHDLSQLCAGMPGAHWTPVENLHLTLRFIGEADGGQYHDIAAALGAVDDAAFDLQLAAVGRFGDRRRARVLWAGVRSSEALDHLQAKIERAVRRAGIAVEPRKFHAHVTLARLQGAPAGRVERYLINHGAYQSRPFPVADFVLFQSFLGQAGAIHQPEVTFPLDGDSI